MLSAVLGTAIAIAVPQGLCHSVLLQTEIMSNKESFSEIKSSANCPFNAIITAVSHTWQLYRIFKVYSWIMSVVQLIQRYNTFCLHSVASQQNALCVSWGTIETWRMSAGSLCCCLAVFLCTLQLPAVNQWNSRELAAGHCSPWSSFLFREQITCNPLVTRMPNLYFTTASRSARLKKIFFPYVSTQFPLSTKCLPGFTV